MVDLPPPLFLIAIFWPGPARATDILTEASIRFWHSVLPDGLDRRFVKRFLIGLSFERIHVPASQSVFL